MEGGADGRRHVRGYVAVAGGEERVGKGGAISISKRRTPPSAGEGEHLKGARLIVPATVFLSGGSRHSRLMVDARLASGTQFRQISLQQHQTARRPKPFSGTIGAEDDCFVLLEGGRQGRLPLRILERRHVRPTAARRCRRGSAAVGWSRSTYHNALELLPDGASVALEQLTQPGDFERRDGQQHEPQPVERPGVATHKYR